jgi:hypothetical protein
MLSGLLCFIRNRRPRVRIEIQTSMMNIEKYFLRFYFLLISCESVANLIRSSLLQLQHTYVTYIYVSTEMFFHYKRMLYVSLKKPQRGKIC